MSLIHEIGCPRKINRVHNQSARRSARNEIYYRRDVSLEELSDGIEAVTNGNIVELASTWFQPAKLAMVLLGDLKGRKITREVFAPLA